LLSFILTAFLPAVSRACAVCFSGGSKDMTRGFFWGVVLLLALPFLMFTFLFTTVVRATKKKKNHENVAS
jgi:hypothetical protein